MTVYAWGFDTGPPQVGASFQSFCEFSGFSLGSRPAFLPSRPYFRVCVRVAVFLSETSLHDEVVVHGNNLQTHRTRNQSNTQRKPSGSKGKPTSTTETQRPWLVYSRAPNIASGRFCGPGVFPPAPVGPGESPDGRVKRRSKVLGRFRPGP